MTSMPPIKKLPLQFYYLVIDRNDNLRTLTDLLKCAR